MSDLAPVVLFVYNRLSHTRQTIESLQENPLALSTDLFIFSDAAKDESTVVSVTNVRHYIKTVSGFKTVTIIERTENYGLSRSIVDGVTSVIEKFGTVIVLEDDMVSSPTFLDFMNDALVYYANTKVVMSVNAYVPPVMCNLSRGVFFTRSPSPWGWATWADRWQYYEKNPDDILGRFTVAQKHKFDFDSTIPNIRAVERNKAGRLNTWAVFWYASIFKQGGLCVSPPYTLIDNIGNDGSGVNCRDTNHYKSARFSRKSIEFSAEIKESAEMFEAYKKFNKMLHPGFLSKAYMLVLGVCRGVMIRFDRDNFF